MAEDNEAFDRLILRFRDLVTAPGGTIETHQHLISKHGCVWWGWWKKSGEAAPALGLSELRSRDDKRVLLFDTGRHALYWAQFNDIRFTRLEENPSPEQDKTPDYYNKRGYEAWFRFVAIDEIESGAALETLNGYSYARRNELFEDGHSHYGVFYGKKVYGWEELRRQDRTMWFARDFREGDRTDEVRLFSNATVSPGHFPERFQPSKSPNLLWVSDLHFSVDGHHAYPVEGGCSPSEQSLGNRIEGTLRQHGVTDLGGLVVSGDITWKADPAEYRQFEGFLGRIARSPSSLDNYRIALAPGNHDLAFSSEPQRKEAPVEFAEAKAREAFSRLYSTLFYIAPNNYCCSGRRYLLGGCMPVEVVCLNSSVLQQEAGWFQGHGFVGEGQLTHVQEEMGWGREPNGLKPFRILVVHHHMMPVVYREKPIPNVSYSVMLDAEAVVHFVVENSVDLVLHGHMHENFFATVTRQVGEKEHTFRIAGLGSTGVNQDHLRPGYGNRVGVLGGVLI